MTLASVTIQITPESRPAMPSWMGEVAAFAQVFTHTGILKTIQEEVRFVRARFGHYDLIDFVVVLLGYTISGEATLKAFYERLVPWASPFMALFGRSQLPHRQPCLGFLLPLISILWKPCERFFKGICLHESRFLPLVVSLIGRGNSGW